MMPDGTYLSGRFVGARRDQVITLMNEALEKWKQLAKQRNLRPKPVPQKQALEGWKQKKQQETGLHIELHYRDLPRKGTQHTNHGRKVGQHHNTTWVELSPQEAKTLVPKGAQWQDVPQPVRDKLFCKGLKDIVYGQSPDWKPQNIRAGNIKVRRGKKTRSGMVIELMGEFNLKDSSHQYQGKLLGKMLWSDKNQKITRMEVAAIGSRSGGTTFNFRDGDEKAAPLGVSFYVNTP